MQAVYAGCCGEPGKGPHMAMALKIKDGMIAEAVFSTYGCPAAQACGQYVAERITGMEVSQAAMIDEAIVTSGVGHMPLGREHCPRLAVGALANALVKYRKEYEET